MNYELALKLKELGFPQEGRGDFIGPNEMVITQGEWPEEFVYFPTLEELIEACGENFRGLNKNLNDNTWTARAFKELDPAGWDMEHYIKGSTPIEAVANLWLALNS